MKKVTTWLINAFAIFAVTFALSGILYMLTDHGFFYPNIQQDNEWSSLSGGSGIVRIWKSGEVIYRDYYDFQRETQDSINNARYKLAKEFIKTMPSNTTQ